MLNMNPVVQVNVSVGASSVSAGVFDVGAIITYTAGTGTPLTATSRFAFYDSFDEIKNGVDNEKPAFGSTTDVYSAASKFFGVSPTPVRLVVIFAASAETPTTAMLDAIDKGAEFYGVYYSPKSDETATSIKTNLIAIVSALDGIKNGMLFYGVTGTSASILDNDGIMKAMNTASAKRAVGMVCTEAVDDVCGFMGVAMGYTHTANERAFALCYKSIATATKNNVTQTEVDNIKGVNGNVYVSRIKNRSGVENGTTASGLRFDDVLYLDKIVHDIQESLYLLIADSPTKLPQNDSTTTLFISEINRILEGYYNIGVLDNAVWHGNDYEGMTENAMIEHGSFAFSESFDSQTQEDRDAHKSMPITILLCLAGSVESVVINLDVQT